LALNDGRQDAPRAKAVLKVAQGCLDTRVLVQRRLRKATLLGNFLARQHAIHEVNVWTFCSAIC
jgi:hypothetical protein